MKCIKIEKKRKNDSSMNYSQIEEYILNIPKFRKEVNMEQTRAFYEYLGKPGKSASIIHVAGTNGKGSTCAYMNSVLTEAGFRVGMFTSPHLVSMRERMRINNALISEQEFIDAFWKIQEVITSIYTPTFYEFLFFMAMLYFEEKQVDVIILETGMGGRLDATNVIDAPQVAVITQIGMDHMEILGDTYEKIAEEKAGIIKAGSKVIYSANRQEVTRVIERKAAQCQVLCKSVEKYVKHRVRFVDKKIDFSFQSRYYGCIPIILNTCAHFQVENASLALMALEELGLEIPKESMIKGIERCNWEGRMEEILPGVFLDGAHNEDGIEAFVASVRQVPCVGKRYVLFSAVADKEYERMKDKLMESKLFDYLYAAPLKNARGITKSELEHIFADRKENAKDESKQINIRIVDRTYEGLEEILSLRHKEDQVYVVGSLYLVGEIKTHLNPKEKP